MNTIDFSSPACGEEVCYSLSEELSLTSSLSSSSSSTLFDECPILRSSEIMYDDITRDVPCVVGGSCGDDLFAELDAEWDREHEHEHEHQCTPCGLMSSGFSTYNPHYAGIYADSFQPETDRIRDFAMHSQQVQPLTAAIVSCGMEMSSYECSNSRVGSYRLVTLIVCRGHYNVPIVSTVLNFSA